MLCLFARRARPERRPALQHPSPRQPPCIDAQAFPHIIDAIIAAAPPASLRKLRQVSRLMCAVVDPLLTDRLVVRFRTKRSCRLRAELPDGSVFPVLSYLLEQSRPLDPWGCYSIPRARVVDLHDPPLDAVAVCLWNYIIDSDVRTVRLFRTALPYAVYRFVMPLRVPRLVLDMRHSPFKEAAPLFTPLVTGRVGTLILHLHCDLSHPLLLHTKFARLDLDNVEDLVVVFHPEGEPKYFTPGGGVIRDIMFQLALFAWFKNLTVVNGDALDPKVRGYGDLLAEMDAAVRMETHNRNQARRATAQHVRMMSLDEYRDSVGDEQFSIDMCE